MESIQQLADEIFRDRVRRARAMSPEEKLCGGIELFDQVCDRMRDGIRMQFPAHSDSEVEIELRRRLQRLRRIEEFGIYQALAEDANG